MSVRVMSWVFEHSEATESYRLVLLALADFADDDGVCWPSMIQIAKKARVSERQARYCVRHLQSIGELSAEVGGGRGNRSSYTILVRPGRKGGTDCPVSESVAKGAIDDIETGQSAPEKGAISDTLDVPILSEPSLEPSLEPSVILPTPLPRIEVDPSIPPGEISIRQGYQEIGRIVNIGLAINPVEHARIVKSRLTQVPGARLHLQKPHLRLIEAELQKLADEGFTEADLITALEGFCAETYWLTYESVPGKLGALWKFLRGSGPSGNGARHYRGNGAAGAHRRALARQSAVVQDPPASQNAPNGQIPELEAVAIWNRTVTAAPCSWKSQREVPPRLTELWRQKEFRDAFERICQNAQKFHQAKGAGAGWLTLRWVVRVKDDGENWFKVRDDELWAGEKPVTRRSKAEDVIAETLRQVHAPSGTGRQVP